jgi:hypothetical protein
LEDRQFSLDRKEGKIQRKGERETRRGRTIARERGREGGRERDKAKRRGRKRESQRGGAKMDREERMKAIEKREVKRRK